EALALGEIGGQHAPLDPAFGHIKDGIEHGPHTEGTRSSTAFSGWDQLFDPLPFLVGQVAWIDFFVHLPIVPTCEDFSDRLSRAVQRNSKSDREAASSAPTAGPISLPISGTPFVRMTCRTSFQYCSRRLSCSHKY